MRITLLNDCFFQKTCKKNSSLLLAKSTEQTKPLGKLDKYAEKNHGRIVIFVNICIINCHGSI